MDQNPIITVITPAYNRAHLLPACYASLCAQTDMDFEWIIVDDGSRDNTESVVRQFDTAAFPIRYIKKENGGKHTALNAAHPYIRGRYVLILDSDDTLTADAVETVRRGWERFENQSNVGVIRFARQTKDGRLCARGKEEYVPTDLLHEQRIFDVSGDSCEVIRTELLKRYPFPVFDGERFLAETALWYRAGVDADCVYINRPVYTCEYLDGGLTKSGKKLQISNPKGGMFNSDLRMNKRCPRKEQIKAGLLYCCYGNFAGLKFGEILSGTEHKGMVRICTIPGYVLYRYWKRKYV